MFTIYAKLQALLKRFTNHIKPLGAKAMTEEKKHNPHMNPDHPHDQVEHDEGHHDCPDHYHRCHTRTVSYGYMDCPHEHEHKPKMVTRVKKIDCGEADPSPQVLADIAIAGNENDLVKAVVDLGHSGWVIFFDHPV